MPKINEQEEMQRRRHTEEMKKKVERLAGHPDAVFLSPELHPGIQEKFLEQVLAFEEADEVPLFETLEKSGISMPPAKSMVDAQLTAKLWEVIHGMALQGYYLCRTDHLSDRELYERLWTDTLREPTSVIPSDSDYSCHIDLLGGWSEEDTRIYFKYYADEEAREDWASRWPEDVIPTHEDPPYDRDRRLPKSPVEIVDSPECS
jgi:hypothetical protein